MIILLVLCMSSMSSHHIFASAIQEKQHHTQPRRSLHFGGIVPHEGLEPNPPPHPPISAAEEEEDSSDSSDTTPMPPVPPPANLPPEPPPTMLSPDGYELLALEFPQHLKRPSLNPRYQHHRLLDS